MLNYIHINLPSNQFFLWLTFWSENILLFTANTTICRNGTFCCWVNLNDNNKQINTNSFCLGFSDCTKKKFFSLPSWVFLRENVLFFHQSSDRIIFFSLFLFSLHVTSIELKQMTCCHCFFSKPMKYFWLILSTSIGLIIIESSIVINCFALLWNFIHLPLWNNNNLRDSTAFVWIYFHHDSFTLLH